MILWLEGAWVALRCGTHIPVMIVHPCMHLITSATPGTPQPWRSPPPPSPETIPLLPPTPPTLGLLQQFGIYVGLIVFCAVLLSLGMRVLTIVTQLVGSRGQKPFLGGRGGAGKGAMGGCDRGLADKGGGDCVYVVCRGLNTCMLCDCTYCPVHVVRKGLVSIGCLLNYAVPPHPPPPLHTHRVASSTWWAWCC